MAVEDLIEAERIVPRDEKVPNMMNIPLPTLTNGPIDGMICEAEEFDPALKAIAAIAETEEKPKNDCQA